MWQRSIQPQCITYACVRYNHDKPEDKINEFKTESKPGLIARFKQMYRDYWYVLVPVHLVTSIGWLSAFYYMAKR